MKYGYPILCAGVFSAISTTASAQATAFRGTHVGFDTASGTAGEQLLLRTGYGTSGAPESEQWSFRFAPGPNGETQLQTRTARYVDNPNAPFAQARYNLWHSAPTNWRPEEHGGGVSPVNGWFAQSSMTANPVTERQTFNPTGADAFVAAERLTGGSFAYEIRRVTPLNNSPVASFALGLMVNPAGNTNDALRLLKSTETIGSDTFDAFGVYDGSLAEGGAVADRSIYLGYGNHFHGWGFFVSERGVYEVEMRAYDVNGVYAESESFTFQVHSIPAPATVLLAAGILARRRRSQGR